MQAPPFVTLALTILGLVLYGIIEMVEHFAMPHRERVTGAAGTA